jgi:diketogulonate reductase-like aldo/keto reductase
MFHSFRNEEEVGEGIKKSNIPREKVYVVTKLWEQNGYDHCLKAFDASLKRYVELVSPGLRCICLCM